jgi:DNA-binding MarR family transcriptional regulator
VTTETAIHKSIYDAKSYDPQHSIGSLFGKVKGAIGAAFETELAPLDITAAQYVILMSLAHGECNSASDLCKGISYDPGAMTRMLDRLERRGLVRRVPNPEDRRAFQLELTDEGRAVVPKLRSAGMKVLNRMLDGFSANEAKQLEGYLLRMLNNA